MHVLHAADPQVELGHEQPLEAQQQVQRGGALLADVFCLQIIGDAASNILQPGDGLGGDVPVETNM